MNDARWEHFPHEADIGVRGTGHSMAEAFEQAALAMTAVITDPALVNDATPVEIECCADDADILLVEWLNALVYEMAVNRQLFSRFEVRLDGHCLNATAWGENLSPERHQPAVEVKGATFTALRVEQQPDDSWLAQCVIDV